MHLGLVGVRGVTSAAATIDAWRRVFVASGALIQQCWPLRGLSDTPDRQGCSLHPRPFIMGDMTSRPLVAVINGPNLNLLGTRQPEIYGTDTLSDIEARCRTTADEQGLDIDFRQSNHEGAIVDAIQELRGVASGFLVNAAAYTHTSVAIRDALATCDAPLVEVHLSNVHAREPFRHHSYLSDIAEAVIVGCGPLGYEFALIALAQRLAPLPPLT